jgi:hypothetical protein
VTTVPKYNVLKPLVNPFSGELASHPTLQSDAVPGASLRAGLGFDGSNTSVSSDLLRDQDALNFDFSTSGNLPASAVCFS